MVGRVNVRRDHDGRCLEVGWCGEGGKTWDGKHILRKEKGEA